MPTAIAPPQPAEIPDFFKTYVGHIGERDAILALERQRQAIATLAGLSPETAALRYAEGKWSVREVVGHIIDAERIFTYRLLRIARGDRTPLPAFDEQEYVRQSNADARTMADLAGELAVVRVSAIALARSLDESALERVGTVRAGEISARAQAFVIAGHFEHHCKILIERYGLADLESRAR